MVRRRRCPDDVAAGLRERYGDVVQRLTFYTASATDPEILNSICGDLKVAA